MGQSTINSLVEERLAHLSTLSESNPALVEDARKRRQNFENRLADRITAFSGSMRFVYLHVIWFTCWIALGVESYPYGLLTMIVSLEAIFLSTFVLISQNRMQAAADERADLDLQINLLSEHEVTRLIKLVDLNAPDGIIHMEAPVQRSFTISTTRAPVFSSRPVICDPSQLAAPP